MADVMRVRKAIAVEHYPVASATVIEIGDILWYDGTNNVVKPAADFAWNTNLATTQGDFDTVFAGVAMSRSASGDTDDIRVATAGEAEFPCASASFNPDEFIGVDDNSTPDGLLSQQVIGVANAGLAIGKPSKVQASVTNVFLIFRSAITGPRID